MSVTVLLAATQGWPFPAQLAAAFHAHGVRIEMLCRPGDVLSASRYPAAFHAYRAVAPAASLRRAMEKARPDLVVPCDDQAAELVQAWYGTKLPASRTAFLAAAAAAGAPAARTVAVQSESALEDAMRQFGLPLVVKVDPSWGGEGVAIARTREEARAAFHRFAHGSRLRDLARAVRRRNPHFLTRAFFPAAPVIGAQRFIAGAPATSSMACWGGQVAAMQHFDVLLTGGGPTGPASVVARCDCPAMDDAARRIAAAFNLSGLFGLDYIRDGGGAVHLLEMNPRATPTAHLMLTQDLPGALLAAAGLPVRPRPPATEKNEIAIFPREWLRDPDSPWLKTAFHDVPWDDPGLVRACIRPAPQPAARRLLAAGPVTLWAAEAR